MQSRPTHGPTPGTNRARCGARASATSVRLAVGLAAALMLLGPAFGPARARAEGTEPPAESPAAATDDAALTGKDIYEKVLDNRFDSYVQLIVMHSGDRGGNIQDTELEMKYLNHRKLDDRITSKSIMKYHAPQDVRHLGYLVINKTDGGEDQFVYRPSARRVRRINLRGEAVFGTDFSFEDIIPQELENSTYQRLPDSDLNGIPVYVVEVTPVAEQDSEYSKFVVYATRSQFVALEVQYWDRDGLNVKQLNADPASITKYEHVEKSETTKTVWVAKSQKIRHLKLDTWTELTIKEIDPTVKLAKHDFSERELARGN